MPSEEENAASNCCLELAGVAQRDVIGKRFQTSLGHVATVVACNPRAAHYQWTVEIEGKKVKCPTAYINWASGQVV